MNGCVCRRVGWCMDEWRTGIVYLAKRNIPEPSPLKVGLLFQPNAKFTSFLSCVEERLCKIKAINLEKKGAVRRIQ